MAYSSGGLGSMLICDTFNMSSVVAQLKRSRPDDTCDCGGAARMFCSLETSSWMKTRVVTREARRMIVENVVRSLSVYIFATVRQLWRGSQK